MRRWHRSLHRGARRRVVRPPWCGPLRAGLRRSRHEHTVRSSRRFAARAGRYRHRPPGACAQRGTPWRTDTPEGCPERRCVRRRGHDESDHGDPAVSWRPHTARRYWVVKSRDDQAIIAGVRAWLARAPPRRSRHQPPMLREHHLFSWCCCAAHGASVGHRQMPAERRLPGRRWAPAGKPGSRPWRPRLLLRRAGSGLTMGGRHRDPTPGQK